MKLNATQICINAPWPIKPAGFSLQKDQLDTYHDDVHARIFGFEDETKKIFLISCDNLGLPQLVHDSVTAELNKNSEKPVFVAVSATHTHFAPSPRDDRYPEFLIPLLVDACKNLDLQEGNY